MTLSAVLLGLGGGEVPSYCSLCDLQWHCGEWLILAGPTIHEAFSDMTAIERALTLSSGGQQSGLSVFPDSGESTVFDSDRYYPAGLLLPWPFGWRESFGAFLFVCTSDFWLFYHLSCNSWRQNKIQLRKVASAPEVPGQAAFFFSTFYCLFVFVFTTVSRICSYAPWEEWGNWDKY